MNEDSHLFIAYYQKDKSNCSGLTRKGITQLFDSASLRAWKDLEEKKFSPHDFRDFVQSGLESSGLNEALISPILAHKVKGIASSYSSHTVKELMESYIKALPYLVPKSVPELENKIKETENKFKKQQHKIEEQDKKIEELEDHFEAKLAETMRNAIDAINQFQKEAQQKPQKTERS
jgi:hypothetical protein